MNTQSNPRTTSAAPHGPAPVLQESVAPGLEGSLFACPLVYIGTLMIQRILAEPAWAKRLTERGLAGLTPLLALTSRPTAPSRTT